MTMIIIYSIALILLLGLSAFFSSSETAFLSISKIRIKQMLKEKVPHAKKIANLKNSIDTLLSTILVGNNFVNSLASSLATALAIHIFGNSGTAIATFVMSILLIIFGEVLPKTIATYHPEKVTQVFAVPLSIIRTIMKPITVLFSFITKMMEFIEKSLEKDKPPVVTEEELKTLIDVGNQEGTLESHEKSMLKKIFEFTDLRIRDIMKHRSMIAGIEISSDYETTIAKFNKWGFSRLVVYSETIDSIVGTIHYKDVLFCKDKDQNFSLKNIMHQPLFVPDLKSADSLLHLFKSERKSIAVAIDEHGSVSGLITMDDILKAVFGRITDEYGKSDIAPEERIEILNHAQFRVPGDIPLHTINQVFNLNLESEDFETLGGWILEQFGSLPSTSEAIKRNNIIFTVEDQSQRRIQTVRLSFL